MNSALTSTAAAAALGFAFAGGVLAASALDPDEVVPAAVQSSTSSPAAAPVPAGGQWLIHVVVPAPGTDTGVSGQAVVAKHPATATRRTAGTHRSTSATPSRTVAHSTPRGSHQGGHGHDGSGHGHTASGHGHSGGGHGHG